MNGLNRWCGMGNLGADPELRFTNSGTAVLNCRLACSEKYFDKKAQQQKERTEWVTVTVWGKRAEALAKFLSKGTRCYVEGRLHTSSYDDREGIKRYRTEVQATELILCGGKSKSGSGGEGTEGRAEAAADLPADDFDYSPAGAGNDEIPF